MDSSNRIVQGFWTGPLTTMERLSMQSFIANGHEFHLYVYDGNMPGVPDNVHLRNAAEIVPESEVRTFRCAQQFSDFFRMMLLLKRGGWHSDLDNICLKPLDFPESHIFYRDHDEATITLALSKAPAGSDLLRHCCDYVMSLDKDTREYLPWQAIGSEFVLGAVEYFGMTEFAQPGKVFDPVHHARVRDIVDPAVEFDLSKSYSVHLFHAAWNRGPEDRTGRGFDLGLRFGEQRLDTDAVYPPECLYETLKRKYL